MKKSLFLTLDGITDPLGGSQILPYTNGLSDLGNQMTILSFEKETNSQIINYTRKTLDENNTQWKYLQYKNKPPIISTLANIRRMSLEAQRLNDQTCFDIIHCRSYIPAIVGNSVIKNSRKKPKIIFDMRGFWPDERVEGGSWNTKNPLFNVIYKYFKYKEKQLINRADAIISLTNAAIPIINRIKKNGKANVTVIPCCTDISHFSREKLPIAARNSARNQLHIPPNTLVLGYLGSTGSWYLLDEMLRYFKELSESNANAIFLFITKDSNRKILDRASGFGIAESKIRIKSANRDQLPSLLTAIDLGISFIKPCFSKQASSPTKLGEMLAMGIPVVSNSGVGDVEQLYSTGAAGHLVHELNIARYRESISQIPQILNIEKSRIRKIAEDQLSLESALKSYQKVYSTIDAVN